MRLYGETRELLKHTEPGKVYEASLAIISLISGCFAISVVPFIRKDFGERYLSWLNLFFGYTVVANFTFLGSIFATLVRWNGQQFMMLFWLAFIAMSVYRRWEISRRLHRCCHSHHHSIDPTSPLPPAQMAVPVKTLPRMRRGTVAPFVEVSIF